MSINKNYQEMKHYKIFKTYILVPTIMAIMSFVMSCTDDVVVTTGDYGKYEAVNSPYGYIKNAIAPSERLVDLYQTNVVRKVQIGLTKAMNHAVDMKISVDESILAVYNSTNNQNYPMLPASLVTIGQSGDIVIPPGYTTSEPINITISSSADLVEGKTYAIPLRISTNDGEVKLTDSQKQYIFFVVAQGERLNPEKSAGYKVVSCMETGDVDPRIHCEFFLSNEGKPLFDYVILFSGNLNYNASSGKVYLHTNNSVGAILNNRDRYIKPLQDMGIKVILGLMGNHDPAGVSHLQEATAIEFVNSQLKPAIEAYGLDGVFWDDEYTSANASIPGFAISNKANASRLIFEAKRAMPDKLNMVFAYRTISSLNEVDGVKAGEYVDYYISDYGATIPIGNFSGSTTKQGMPMPYEFAQGKQGSPSSIVKGNWGGIMVFALNDQSPWWDSFGFPALKTITTTMFQDELYYTGKSYPVEW